MITRHTGICSLLRTCCFPAAVLLTNCTGQGDMACPAPTPSDLSIWLRLPQQVRGFCPHRTSLPTQRGICLNVQDCQEVKGRFSPEFPEKSYPATISQSTWRDAGREINRLGARLPALDSMSPTSSCLSMCVFGLWTLKVQAPSK